MINRGARAGHESHAAENAEGNARADVQSPEFLRTPRSTVNLELTMFRRTSKQTDTETLNACYRYALALTGSQQDAEDLVQEGWLKLSGRFGNKPDRPLLFRTVRNLFIDQTRRQRRVEDYRTRYSDHPADSVPCHGSAAAEFSNLEQPLQNLRDIERETLFLSVVEGYTASEIAKLTGMTRGSVLSMLHRTRRKLQAAIDDDPADSPANGESSGSVTSETLAEKAKSNAVVVPLRREADK
jgi:RNA polymerase sigma-70 factor (ECF subfamily)